MLSGSSSMRRFRYRRLADAGFADQHDGIASFSMAENLDDLLSLSISTEDRRKLVETCEVIQVGGNLPQEWRQLETPSARENRTAPCQPAGRCRLIDKNSDPLALKPLHSWRGTILALQRVMSRPLRSLVAISGDRQRAELLGALLMSENDYDVVFVESIGRGYSRIKEQTPDLVILYLEIGDVAAWQLLSMLKIDSDLSAIPVVTTWTPRPEDGEVEHIASETLEDLSCPVYAVQMN
jgi:hypothetical protein